MALTSADLARLGPKAQKQVLDKDLSAVSHSVSAMRKNPQKKRRFASVWTVWSDREYAKYFGEVRA